MGARAHDESAQKHTTSNNLEQWRCLEKMGERERTFPTFACASGCMQEEKSKACQQRPHVEGW